MVKSELCYVEHRVKLRMLVDEDVRPPGDDLDIPRIFVKYPDGLLK